MEHDKHHDYWQAHDKDHDQDHVRSKAREPPAEAPCRDAPPLAGMEPMEATDAQLRKWLSAMSPPGPVREQACATSGLPREEGQVRL